MLTDAHCHFFSSRFLELLSQPLPDLPADGRAAAVASRLGWKDPGDPAALGGDLDRRAGPALGLSRGADRQHPRRRDLRCRRRPSASRSLRRLLHVQSRGAGCRGTTRARLHGARPALRVPVSRDAPLSTGRCVCGDRLRERGASPRGGVRALRRAQRRRPRQAGAAVAVRSAPRRSARAGVRRLPGILPFR